MTLVAGTTIGPYRIIDQIGRGGMATVYKAYQASLARNVAIKVLPAFFAEDPGFRERFQQEAIAVAKLRHPNILQVFDYGEENGVTYIVSEFIDGGTLAEQLGAPLPADYTVRILAPMAAALDYAHARGILHRDIKPSNVLLARDGTPILSDFGLAKMVGSMPRLTQTGTAVGTPEYMAPEQGMGETIGPAADQYALGVVAYEMLTGRVPFSAETPLAVLLAHVHKPLPLPRSVNPALSEGLELVLLKALAKVPGDRYPRVGEFVNAISDAARGVPVVTPGPIPVAAPVASVVAPAAAGTSVPTKTVTAGAPGARTLVLRIPSWRVLAIAAVVLVAGVGFAVTREPEEKAEEEPDVGAPTAAVATRPAQPAAATASKPTKGKLIWQAKLEASEFQASPAFPDPSAAAVRTVPGAIELAILKPQASIGISFNEFPPAAHFIEVDLEMKGANLDLTWMLRSGRTGSGHQLRVTTTRQAVQIEQQDCAGGSCNTVLLAQPTTISGMRDGKKFTVGVAVQQSGLVAFVDGSQVAEVKTPAVGEPGMFAGVFGLAEGTVRILGVRLYELVGGG